MPINVEVERENIEEKWIGFSPSSNSVKPAHIANGLFRTVLDATFDTQLLHRFVFSQTKEGEVPKGHDIDTIYERLIKEHKIDESDVTKDTLGRLRILLKKVVGADDAVFTGAMQSYSAGFSSFVAKDTIAQDGGELIAAWFQRKSPLLHTLVKDSLLSDNDTITRMCIPLLSNKSAVYNSSFDFDDVRFLNTPLPQPIDDLWKGLAEAATTLAEHVETHPNKLLRLRLIVLFASFVLIRELSWLEAMYVPGAEKSLQPILLDFSTSNASAISQASEVTYTRICQSIARFYAWAFGEQLRMSFTLDDLRREQTPVYKKRSTPEMEEVWRMASLEAEEGLEDFTVYGQALYDILAQEAEGNPVGYLRQLGSRIGLLTPPANFFPTKRFRLQQDLLETLVRGAIHPGEVLDMPSLQDRFWLRYGLVIGGRPIDERRLLEAGIYQADTDALQENRQHFASRLGALDFASLLADGVLQIEVGAPRVV
jgi:hypothetical protein